MELMPNWTLWIQLLIYISLIFILKKLYFEPILAALHRREGATVGRAAEADTLLQKTIEMRAGYEARLVARRQSLDIEKTKAMSDIQTLVAAKIQKVRLEAGGLFAKQNSLIDLEISKVRARLPELSNEIKDEVVRAMTTSKVIHL